MLPQGEIELRLRPDAGEQCLAVFLLWTLDGPVPSEVFLAGPQYSVGIPLSPLPCRGGEARRKPAPAYRLRGFPLVVAGVGGGEMSNDE